MKFINTAEILKCSHISIYAFQEPLFPLELAYWKHSQRFGSIMTQEQHTVAADLLEICWKTCSITSQR